MQEFIITMPSRITTDNVDEFQKAINESIANIDSNSNDNEIIFDAGNTVYISSAGLRCILAVRKKYSNVQIINCSLEVYDILEVTGFTEMLTVKKKLKEVSTEGLISIGKGGQGEAWRREDGTILKTFIPSVDIKEIEEEKRIARYLFSLGFPTCIPFDLVKCGEGYGIIYELMTDGTMSEALNGGLIEFDDGVQHFSKLFNDIHEVEDLKGELKQIKTLYFNYVENVKDIFSDSEIEFLFKLVDKLPDGNTIVHGDLHPKNIMKSQDDYYVIDVGEVTCGHPLFDYIATYCDLYLQIRLFPDLDKYMGMSAERLMKFWEEIEPMIINSEKGELERVRRLLNQLGCLQMVHLLSRHIPMPVNSLAIEFVRKNLLSVNLDDLIDEIRQLEHCFRK